MPNIVQKTTKTTTYNNFNTTTPQHPPHEWLPLIYVSITQQQAITLGTTTMLSLSDTKFIKNVLSSFIYYGQAIDSTILTALN